jgi:hypothetical protein
MFIDLSRDVTSRRFTSSELLVAHSAYGNPTPVTNLLFECIGRLQQSAVELCRFRMYLVDMSVEVALRLRSRMAILLGARKRLFPCVITMTCQRFIRTLERAILGLTLLQLQSARLFVACNTCKIAKRSYFRG